MLFYKLIRINRPLLLREQFKVYIRHVFRGSKMKKKKEEKIRLRDDKNNDLRRKYIKGKDIIFRFLNLSLQQTKQQSVIPELCFPNIKIEITPSRL